MESEEKKLAESVINMGLAHHYNGNGPDTSMCMLCHERVDYITDDLLDIDHSPDCGYLIAKSLLTGLI